VSEWFEHDTDSPYMLLVANVQKNKRLKITDKDKRLFGIDKLNIPRSSIPAITHVDYSARIQTVHENTNSQYHAVISKFKEKTGCPMVVNTSFNVRGEPIVCSPTDAFNCFMGTELDVLAIGNFFLFKKDQDKSLKVNYKNRYELD
jgi:carbamoyltransferase